MVLQDGQFTEAPVPTTPDRQESITDLAGRTREESIPLLDRLCSQSDLLEYQCRFQWESDSIAFWDNRSAQHYAVSDYWPQVRRVERVTIAGDTPYYDPTQEPDDLPARPFRGNLTAWTNS